LRTDGQTDRRYLFAMLRNRLKKTQRNMNIKLFQFSTSYKLKRLSVYSDYSTEWTTEDSWFESRHRLEIIICSETSRPTVGPIQPHFNGSQKLITIIRSSSPLTSHYTKLATRFVIPPVHPVNLTEGPSAPVRAPTGIYRLVI
jgi:hypothetical protein